MFYTDSKPDFSLYAGALTDYHELDQFVRGYRNPVVSNLNPETVEHVLTAQLPVMVVVVDHSDTRTTRLVEAAVTSAAGQLRTKLVVAVADVAGPFEKRLLGTLGVEDHMAPTARILKVGADGNVAHKGTLKFKLPENYSESDPTSEKFYLSLASMYMSDKLKPYLKSEVEPDYDPSNPVKIIVGDTFQREVIDKAGTDVFLAFVAPWCGHCRRLDGAWRELAKRVKHVKTLVIGKIDATRNETPDFPISGYPTILLFRAGEGTLRHSPVEFTGVREVREFLTFLREKVTHSSELQDIDSLLARKTTRSVVSAETGAVVEVEEL